MPRARFVPYTFSLPPRLVADLKVLADKKAASVSQLIRDAIVAALKREKRESADAR